jgi:hypothetical protein
MPGRFRLKASLLGVNMNDSLPYKNYFINCESFQREKHGSWVPQYTITRQGTDSGDFPSHQYQFSHTHYTKNEADRFAVEKAREWIDKNQKPFQVPVLG